MSEETTTVEIETVGWKNAVITEGERKGSQVLVALINPSGLYQVIFATGASGWYLPEDLKIQEREGL